MKILIAPDKLRGSLTAREAADAIAAGARLAHTSIECDLCPMADGGEGTVSALVAATGGRFLRTRVTGPLPEMKVDAEWGFLGDGHTAVIEMSAASGLALLPPSDRNPLNTTSFGTGELLNAAVAMGARSIILGIGGSATCDAGIGCAQATGHTIVLRDGEPVAPTEPLTASDISRVVLIKRHRGEKTDGIPITVACDVNNPLCGPNGTAAIFAPQKGATPHQVIQLESALGEFVARTGSEMLANTPGAGAAGGLGYAMLAYYGGTIRNGINIVMEATGIAGRLQDADLCLTAEGRLDAQSVSGKTISGIAAACALADVPCIALAGTLADSSSLASIPGLTACFSIIDGPRSLESAMMQTRPLLMQTAANIVRVWLALQKAKPRPTSLIPDNQTRLE